MNTCAGNIKKVDRTIMRLMLYRFYGYTFQASFYFSGLRLGCLFSFFFFAPLGFSYTSSILFDELFCPLPLKKKNGTYHCLLGKHSGETIKRKYHFPYALCTHHAQKAPIKCLSKKRKKKKRRLMCLPSMLDTLGSYT